MSIEVIDGMIMPIITAACLCIGYVMKKWMPTDDKWIPTVLSILGAVSGLMLFGVNYEGVVKGMVSGLAAIGLHQMFKQHLKLEDSEKIQTAFNAEGIGALYDAEDVEDEAEKKTTEK